MGFYVGIAWEDIIVVYLIKFTTYKKRNCNNINFRRTTSELRFNFKILFKLKINS